MVGISPLLEGKVSTVERDGKPDAFVRKGEWSKPLPLRGLYSYSPQGSVFEVSGIRGPCFSSFHPSYDTPFPVAMDQCISLEADTVQQATLYFTVALLVFPATSVLDVTTWFSPSSAPVLAKHLGFRPKETSHFRGKGSSLFLPIHGAEPLPCCLCRRNSCCCSTCVCRE